MARKREFDPEQALDRALHLFWEKGYAHTSMRDLVEATGVAPAGLYAAFGDKKSLYVKALQKYRDEYFDRMIAELLQDDAVPSDISLVFDNIGSRMQTLKRGIGCLWTNGAAEFGGSEPDLVELFQWNALRLDKEFQRVLSRAAHRGEWMSAFSPSEASAQLVTLFHGILVLARGKADPDLINRSVQVAKTLVKPTT